MGKAPIALITIEDIHCRISDQLIIVFVVLNDLRQNMSHRSKKSEAAHLIFWNWRFRNASNRGRPEPM